MPWDPRIDLSICPTGNDRRRIATHEAIGPFLKTSRNDQKLYDRPENQYTGDHRWQS